MKSWKQVTPEAYHQFCPSGQQSTSGRDYVEPPGLVAGRLWVGAGLWSDATLNRGAHVSVDHSEPFGEAHGPPRLVAGVDSARVRVLVAADAHVIAFSDLLRDLCRCSVSFRNAGENVLRLGRLGVRRVRHGLKIRR